MRILKSPISQAITLLGWRRLPESNVTVVAQKIPKHFSMRRHIFKPWTISAESWNDQAAGTVAFFLTETTAIYVRFF